MDNAATSILKPPACGAAMANYIENVGCNIGRGGYQSAYDAAGVALDTQERLNAPSPRPQGRLSF